MNLCLAQCSSEFDVMHSHAYLWDCRLMRFSRAPNLHTLHVHPYEDSVQLRARCRAPAFGDFALPVE